MIQLIQGERQTGRTTKLIEWILGSTKEEIRVGVFRTPELSMIAYRSTFREIQPPWFEATPRPDPYMGSPVESWQFISWQDFEPHQMRGSALRFKNVVFGVDDLDTYIQQRLFQGVGLVTMGTWQT